APWPSSVPDPVMAMLVRPSAWNRGEKFMHSMPCHRVSTTGYFFGSVLNRIVAPEARFRLTLSSSSMAPVSHLPAGTVTRPPPAALHALTALANAAVLSVVPLPFAPYEVTGKSLAGKVGGLIRARIAGTTVVHGSAAAGAAVVA